MNLSSLLTPPKNENKFYSARNLLTIAEVPALSLKCGYLLALGLFLDCFYECDAAEKISLLTDEPKKGILKLVEHCKLAAAAHKLAHDNHLPVPSWVMKSEYIMPYPIYAFNTEDSESQEFLRKVTPDEYRLRNLFLGPGVLKRV